MDHRKLVKAGFRIFRKEEQNKIIKELVVSENASFQSHGWSYYGRYETKKAMNEAFAELMKDDKNIEG